MYLVLKPLFILVSWLNNDASAFCIILDFILLFTWFIFFRNWQLNCLLWSSKAVYDFMVASGFLLSVLNSSFRKFGILITGNDHFCRCETYSHIKCQPDAQMLTFAVHMWTKVLLPICWQNNYNTNIKYYKNNVIILKRYMKIRNCFWTVLQCFFK